MEEIKVLIVSILLERKGQLSYYQIERKLKNKNKHDLILGLRKALNELLKEDFIIELDSEEPCFYKISSKSENGIIELVLNINNHQVFELSLN